MSALSILVFPFSIHTVSYLVMITVSLHICCGSMAIVFASWAQTDGEHTRKKHYSILKIDHFTLISVGCYSEYIVGAVFHAVIHVIHHTIFEKIFFK